MYIRVRVLASPKLSVHYHSRYARQAQKLLPVTLCRDTENSAAAATLLRVSSIEIELHALMQSPHIDGHTSCRLCLEAFGIISLEIVAKGNTASVIQLFIIFFDEAAPFLSSIYFGQLFGLIFFYIWAFWATFTTQGFLYPVTLNDICLLLL